MAYIRSLDKQTIYSHLPVIQSSLNFQMNVFQSQKANDHCDIILRVFREKQKKLR